LWPLGDAPPLAAKNATATIPIVIDR